jgi:hypothetical protein
MRAHQEFVVTTDSQGNLASDGGQLFRGIGRVESGVAIAIAMATPDLAGNEKFGFAANWGTFEGANALAFTAAGVLGKNWLGGGERWTVAGGVGFTTNENSYADQSSGNQVAGRAGLQVSW